MLVRGFIHLVRLGSAVGCLLWVFAVAPFGGAVEIRSPGLPPSQMDDKGRLIEDWGTVAIEVVEAPGPLGELRVEAIELLDGIPAARAICQGGDLALRWVVYRAPVFPAGVDVLTIEAASAASQERTLRIRLGLPEGTQVGLFGAQLKDRQVVTVLPESFSALPTREWGYVNETTAMPSWARPEGQVDPAFANIRAGMGGIPILYRFKVAPRSQAVVILGICESHYAQAAVRPVLYEVEGARPEVVDPIERWGRHQPGTLVFRARDVNGDGQIEVAARPLPAAPDRNPILNVIWVFPPDRVPNPAKLISGELSQAATYYVDVGGARDQCFYEIGPLDFPLKIAPGSTAELTFLVACPGASAPRAESTVWTRESLLRAAREVWLAWKK